VLSDLAGITDDADGFAEHGPVGDGGPAGRPDGSDGS
jgi:hypothetical protein